MPSFFNPYHFVPLPATTTTGYVDRGEAEKVLKQEDDQTVSAKQMRHDQYGQQSDESGQPRALNSGRIICKLTTVSPCVFGNVQDQSEKDNPNAWSAKIHNFELDGKPAIAATTLRGCIGSLAEAISGSSMRVLVKPPRMSVRTDMASARSPIGMIYQTSKDGPRFLLPLTMPPMQRFIEAVKHGGSDPGVPFEPRHNTPAWKHMVQHYLLDFPVYLNRYDFSSNEGHRLDRPQDFLKTHVSDSFCSTNANDFWMMPFDATMSPGFTRTSDGKLQAGTGTIGRWQDTKDRSQWQTSIWKIRSFPPKWNPKKQKNEQTDMILARLPSNVPGHNFGWPVMLATQSAIPDTIWRPGVIRRLAMPGDSVLLFPRGKKHEVFIPIDAYFDSENRRFDPAKCVPHLIDVESQCHKFEKVADANQDIHEDQRPVRLKGQEGERIRLRHGDLVHFRLCPDLDAKNQPIVESVAISSIWREDAGELYEYFRACGLGELLPWNEHRKMISPVEQIFGFVEQKSDYKNAQGTPPDEEGRKKRLTAYAGRVRFSPGRFCPGLSTEATEPELTSKYSDEQLGAGNAGWFPLRILASPKLPCPEFYFCDKEGRLVPRKLFNGLNATHRPRGWKFYLHDPRAIMMKTIETDGVKHFTWETGYPGWDKDGHLQEQLLEKARSNQKMLVRPVKTGQVFFFHIDFDNLDDRELGLILRALQPVEDFHHKLGLGKPLGLGSVKIDIEGVFLIERHKRYTEALNLLSTPKRYHTVARGNTLTALKQWPETYEREREILESSPATPAHSRSITDLQLPASPAAEIEAVLELFGNPEHIERFLNGDATNTTITYPHTGNTEDKLYEWFTNNVVGEPVPKGLKPVTEETPQDELRKHKLLHEPKKRKR